LSVQLAWGWCRLNYHLGVNRTVKKSLQVAVGRFANRPGIPDGCPADATRRGSSGSFGYFFGYCARKQGAKRVQKSHVSPKFCAGSPLKTNEFRLGHFPHEEPESSASANSATWATCVYNSFRLLSDVSLRIATQCATVLPNETHGNAGQSFWCKFNFTTL
jgi:hypothetical protein